MQSGTDQKSINEKLEKETERMWFTQSYASSHCLAQSWLVSLASKLMGNSSCLPSIKKIYIWSLFSPQWFPCCLWSIWKGFISFSPQRPCTTSFLPPLWERHAEHIPAWNTYFNRAFLKPANTRAVALSSWTPMTLTQDFTRAQTLCSPSGMHHPKSSTHVLCSGAAHRNEHASHRLFPFSCYCFPIWILAFHWAHNQLTPYFWKEMLILCHYFLLISSTEYDIHLSERVSFSISWTPLGMLFTGIDFSV